MKRCFKCHCEKPLEAFYKHAGMADGRLNKCKECTKKDVAEHRQANLERVRSYDRMRASQPHRLALQKRLMAEYVQKHPERRKAHLQVEWAVRKGQLERHPCFVCGAQKVEGHHPDYDRPLDVVWLCVPHHRQAHALVANHSELRGAA
jgi:hypothetical protein